MQLNLNKFNTHRIILFMQIVVDVHTVAEEEIFFTGVKLTIQESVIKAHQMFL